MTRGTSAWIEAQGEGAAMPGTAVVGAVAPVIADGVPEGAIVIHRPEVPSACPLLETLEGVGRILGEVVVRTRAGAEGGGSDDALAMALAAAPDAQLAVDHHGNVVLSNEAAEERFGYGPEEAAGRPVRTLLPELQTGDAEDRGLESALRALAARRYVRALRRDGSSFPACLTVSRSPAGDRGVVLTVRDLTEQLQTERSLAEAAATQGLLAQAGRLLVSSLDYGTTLESVAELTVRALADWCIVYVMQDDGTLRRIQVAHADPDDRLLAERLRSRALPCDLPFPVLDVYRSGETVWASDLDRGARPEDPDGVLRSLGAASFVAVPLKVRGTTFGVIAMVSRDPARSFGPASVAVAEKLAALYALAIDNARLYGEAREATRAKDELLHLVTHDLRNPLAAIRMGLGRLHKHAAESPAAGGNVETLDRMKDLTDRMTHMIDRLEPAAETGRARDDGSDGERGTGIRA